MVKINHPPYPAKIYLNYTGRRETLVNTFSTFQNINIEFEKSFDLEKESLAANFELIDGQRIFLGILSRNIYILRNDDWLKDENAYFRPNQIIVGKKFTYIEGLISIDIDLNGEIINDSYEVKIFLNAGSKVNEFIANGDFDFEKFDI